MTPEELHQFNSYGCVARSILLLAQEKHIPTTMDDFCERFRSRFLIPGQFGNLFISQVGEVAGALGLGSQFLTFRRYEEIDGHFNRGRRDILAASEINLSPGATEVARHCSLLTQIDHQGFTIRTPKVDGSDDAIRFVRDEWDTKLFHGVVLYTSA